MHNLSQKGILFTKKFGSTILCNSSMNIWIESVNYSKQRELYLFGKNADISEVLMLSKIIKKKDKDLETLIIKGIFFA